jgi:aminopeptidase N
MGQRPAAHRPHPVAYLLAVVLPLVLLLTVAAPWGIARVVAGLRPSGTSSSAPPAPSASPTSVDPSSADEGLPGLGDPYYPDAGNSGYDALRYAIAISWDPAAERLTGHTVVTARATQPLRSFYLDLALTAEQVSVDGQPAAFEKLGFADLRVTPARPLAAGAKFEVTVDYSGLPTRLRQGKLTPWRSFGQEWTVANEPESSAWWYPANDHPSDPALMDVSVRVPAGLTAVSVGALESKDTAREAGFDTWHWVARQPMASYLNFVSIGRFELEEGTVDGRPYVYAVSEQVSAEDRRAAFTSLRRSAAIVEVCESMFGPYPFTELGGVVPAGKLPFAGLETQTRPVYALDAIISDRFAAGLLTHELAHMWFGDNVTLRQWNDIFTNEAYASWAEWGYAERTGGRTADAAFDALFERVQDRDEFWRVTMVDPGRQHLFDVVYSRGPMTLQALRNVIGDDAFFALAREWAQDPGSRSLEDWMVRAQAKTQVDLSPFFQAWLYAATPPARTAANGFR